MKATILGLAIVLVSSMADGQTSDYRPVNTAPASDANAPRSGAASLTDNETADQRSSEFLERVSSPTRNATVDALGGSRSLFRDDPVDRGSIMPSATGNGAARERDRLLSKAQQAPLQHDYNIKIGSMLFWFDAGLSFEYSDNIAGASSGGIPDNFRSDSRFNNVAFRDLRTTSGNRRESDLIIRPQINMHGYLKITEFNSLTLEVGLGYVKYVNHPEFDTSSSLLYLSPATAISFDVKVGDVLLTFYERPAIPQDQSDIITLRRTFSYSRFVNTAGVTAFWDLNRIVLTAGYSHFNSIALRSELKFLDQSSDQVFGSILFKLSESLSTGVESSVTYVRYSEKFQNDGVTYSVGPFAEIRFTDFLKMRVSAGYQGGTFQSNGSNGDNSSPGSYYANATIQHNLNAYFNHQLSLGHESQLGTSSNFVNVNYLRYGATWDILNRVSVGGDASFEDARESGGFFAQDIRRYSAGVFFSYFLTKKLAIGLHYRFTRRDSTGSSSQAGDSSLDYYENRVGLDFHYTF